MHSRVPAVHAVSPAVLPAVSPGVFGLAGDVGDDAGDGVRGAVRGQGDAQFQNLQLWRCHGYASNGTPQRWLFQFVGNYGGIGAPEYRIANVGSGLCIGLDPNRVNISWDAIAGSNLVQESCISNLTIWIMDPAITSPDPNNQFHLLNDYGLPNHLPYAMEANTFLDQNGNRLIAEPWSHDNSAQWYALG